MEVSDRRCEEKRAIELVSSDLMKEAKGGRIRNTVRLRRTRNVVLAADDSHNVAVCETVQTEATENESIAMSS